MDSITKYSILGFLDQVGIIFEYIREKLEYLYDKPKNSKYHDYNILFI